MRVVVLGAGDVGTFLASQLSKGGDELILVDTDAKRLSAAEEAADVLTLQGDITHRSVLEAAEIARADLVAAVTSSDNDNIVGAALAASGGARRAIARVDAPGFYSTTAGVERGVLGVHALLCVSRLVSEELLRLVTRLDTTYAQMIAGNALELVLVPIDASSPARGKLAGDLKVGKQAVLVGVLRDALLRPPADVGNIELGDQMLVVGPATAVTRSVARLRGKREQRRVVIVGGGDVGIQVASTLLAQGRRVQVIDHDLARCEKLAAAVPTANIVHGDGTSIATLRDERVEAAELLIAVTRKDEVNLMASLMAADLGIERTFALVHRPGYEEVYRHLGIRGTAGPHLAIGEMVRWLMPHDGGLVRKPLPRTSYELVEYQLPRDLTDAFTLADLQLVPDVLWIAATHEGGERASRSEAVGAGAHVIGAVPKHGLRELNRRLRHLFRGARA